MLNRTLFSLAVVCCIHISVNAQKDPRKSVHHYTFDLKSKMVDYMPLNESRLVVLKSVSGENYIEVVGSSAIEASKLEIEYPIGFYKDAQNDVYLMSADSAYKLSVSEGMVFNSPEPIELFKQRVEAMNLPLKTRFKGLYANGETDLIRYTEEGIIDTIKIEADYRCATIKWAEWNYYGSKPIKDRNTNYYPSARIPSYFEVDSTGRPVNNLRIPLNNSLRGQSTNYGKDVSKMGNLYEPEYIMDGEQILIIDGDGDQVARYSANGVFQSIHDIDYARPIIWTESNDRFMYNLERRELFIGSKNSKGYQFSRLDPETGLATLIFKTKKYWRMSDSKIVGDTMYYIQSNSFGVDELYSVNL